MKFLNPSIASALSGFTKAQAELKAVQVQTQAKITKRTKRITALELEQRKDQGTVARAAKLQAKVEEFLD